MNCGELIGKIIEQDNMIEINTTSGMITESELKDNFPFLNKNASQCAAKKHC